MSIETVFNSSTQKAYEANSKKQQNIKFGAKTQNSLERNPHQDNLVKNEKSKGGKIVLCAVSLTCVAALLDALFCKGKHMRQLFNLAEKEGSKSADDMARGVQNQVSDIATTKAAQTAEVGEKATERLRQGSECIKESLDTNYERTIRRSKDGSRYFEGIRDKKTGKLESCITKINGKTTKIEIIEHYPADYGYLMEISKSDKRTLKKVNNVAGNISIAESVFDNNGNLLNYSEHSKMTGKTYEEDRANAIAQFISALKGFSIKS